MPVQRNAIRFLLPVFAVGLCAVPGLSQAPASASAERPPAGDPQVAYMFLTNHHRLLAEVSARRSNGTMDSAREQSIAASMKLSVEDFEAVGPVYGEVQPLLDAVDHDADAYRDRVRASGGRPDPKVYQGFTARKTVIESSIRSRLEAKLSPAAWKDLEAYIDGDFRQRIRVTGMGPGGAGK